MPWFFASSGHQQPWYWLCEIGKSWSSTRKDSNYLYHINVEDWHKHYNDIIMSMMVSQITSLVMVYSSVYSGADQRTHQSFASVAFVQGIHQWPVNSPHKGPVMRKMFSSDHFIMKCKYMFLFPLKNSARKGLSAPAKMGGTWCRLLYHHRWDWRLSNWLSSIPFVMIILSVWPFCFRHIVNDNRET